VVMRCPVTDSEYGSTSTVEIWSEQSGDSRSRFQIIEPTTSGPVLASWSHFNEVKAQSS
jgi:hypothetical protein